MVAPTATTDGPRSRAGKQHSTALAWTVKQKSSKRYRLEEHELFKLGDGAQVYADVYKIDGDQPEERQEKDTFTQGFRPLISSLAFEHERLPIQQFRAKRCDLRRKINDLRSRSRKKKYADNPIPSLVQVSAEERGAFIARLSDLQVSLGDLAQMVPFGFKADNLLELMVARRVPPQRATWLIKVVYLNMYADKNKARGGVRRPVTDRKLKCKDDWSEQLHQFVSRVVQLDLQSPDSAARRAYLLSLVTWQYRAGLISRVKTLYWIIGQLDECTAQDSALLHSAFYLPLVCRFIEDVQISRMHSYRLFTACSVLVKKTQVGRTMQHEAKTNICNVSEAILLYLNDVIPLSCHWRGALATSSASLSLTTSSKSGHFNLPRFLLDLDCISECNLTCPGVGRVNAILQSHGQLSVDALLEWSISLYRQYHKFRALVASFLLAQFRSVNESVVDYVATFVCRFQPACADEAHQAVIVYTELSRLGLYDAAKVIRAMVARGLLGNAVDSYSPQYMFCRFLLEWVPLPNQSPRYVVTQRSMYLYGVRSPYDDLLRKRLLSAVCRHLDQRSLGLFLPALAVTEANAHRAVLESENSDFADGRHSSWTGFVNTDDPSQTDLRSIVNIAPLYHMVPILNICVAAFLRMNLASSTECRMLVVLALDDTFRALYTALFVSNQFSVLCSFLISALDQCVSIHHTVIHAIRASYPLFQCLSLEFGLRNAFAALMRRELQVVQQAEVWVVNARLPSSMSRWLSENVVQNFFSGRYHNTATSKLSLTTIGTEQLQHELLTLMKSIGPETKLEDVDMVLSRIAIDNQSIGAIVSFFLDQILVQTENRDDFVPRALHLLHRVSLASDRLGENRVPCHDIILTQYVSKLTDLLLSPSQRDEFVLLAISLVNAGLLQLNTITERVVVRPLRIALSSKCSTLGSAVSCLLATTLLGASVGEANPDSHYLMQCGLISEPVSAMLPVLTLLAELGLHSDIPQLTPLARQSLESILSSQLFSRFCLSSLPEVYSQIVNLPSARWLFRCLRWNQNIPFPAYIDDEPDDESVPYLLKSLSPWTVHVQWIDVQLAVQAQNRRHHLSNAEQQLAQYLLMKPETGNDLTSADISVELIKLLPALIGKHILNAVQASLTSENKEFLQFIGTLDVFAALMHAAPDQSSESQGSWRIPSETAVQALSVCLSISDCVSFVASLSEQLMEVVRNLPLYSDSSHLQPLVLKHVMTRVRCLQYMTGVALQRTSECHFHDLVRALLSLLLSDIFLQADHTEFDSILAVFERLIDDLRFGENAPADGSAAQRKEDEFIINLDRECSAIQIPLKYQFSWMKCFSSSDFCRIRRKIQRTLPTFSGAIIDYRPSNAVPSSLPISIAPVTTPSALSPNLFAIQSSAATMTSLPTSSIVSVQDDLYSVDPWTILQGVPGIPLVQKLLENSSIMTRDGSSIDPDS